MRVDSDVADELHVHSTPEHKFKIEPGRRSSSSSRSDVPGQVDDRAASTAEDDRHRPSAAVTDRPVAVLAHGLGGSTDLPIPYTYALIGAAWALTFTFAVVAFAWRQPRFDPDKPGRAAAAVGDDGGRRAGHPMGAGRGGSAVRRLGGDGRVVRRPRRQPAARRVLRAAVGRAGGGVVGGRADLAGDLTDTHACIGCFGWRALPPVAAIPGVLGYWPAVFGLFAFVWLELASPDPGSLGAIKLWLWVYIVVTLTGAIVCGDRWFGRADPFEVYSVVASRFSPFRRNPQSGRIEIGNPFDHLPSLPIRPGTVTVLAVLLGSTAFDSFSAMPVWRNFVDRHTDSAAAATLLRTAGLLVFVTVVVVTFWLAARATGGVDRRTRRELPG